jgi:hypothetical protein
MTKAPATPNGDVVDGAAPAAQPSPEQQVLPDKELLLTASEQKLTATQQRLAAVEQVGCLLQTNLLFRGNSLCVGAARKVRREQ